MFFYRSGDNIDFRTARIRDPTFFVPGAFGFGNSSILSRVMFPYFRGIDNIDVVDVGPLNSAHNRARVLHAHIKHVCPEWSDRMPINLVGHSLGCNTIMRLILMDEVSPASINAIVELSPVTMGVHCTHRFGRDGNLYWYWWPFFKLLLSVYEQLVPESIRRRVLLNTMLPTNFSVFDRRMDWSVAVDVDELVANDLSTRAYQYISHHAIRIETLYTSCTVISTGFNGRSTYTIPWSRGPLLILRFLDLIMGIGRTTDYDEGFSFVTKDTSCYRVRNGHHDGILTVQSQLAGRNPTNFVHIDHLSTVVDTLLPPLMMTIDGRRQSMQVAIASLTRASK